MDFNIFEHLIDNKDAILIVPMSLYERIIPIDDKLMEVMQTDG
jgi:hypothetical protein